MNLWSNIEVYETDAGSFDIHLLDELDSCSRWPPICFSFWSSDYLVASWNYSADGWIIRLDAKSILMLIDSIRFNGFRWFVFVVQSARLSSQMTRKKIIESNEMTKLIYFHSFITKSDSDRKNRAKREAQNICWQMESYFTIIFSCSICVTLPHFLFSTFSEMIPLQVLNINTNIYETNAQAHALCCLNDIFCCHKVLVVLLSTQFNASTIRTQTRTERERERMRYFWLLFSMYIHSNVESVHRSHSFCNLFSVKILNYIFGSADCRWKRNNVCMAV